MMPFRLKLRSKLLISFLALGVMGTLTVGYGVYSEMRPHFLEAVEVTLIDTSRLLSSQITADTGPGEKLNVTSLSRTLQVFTETNFPERNHLDKNGHENLLIYVTDERGVVIFDSNQGLDEGKDYSRWRDVHLSLQGFYGARATRRSVHDPNTSIHYVAAPILVNGKTMGVVSVGKPVASLASFLAASKFRLTLILAFALSAAVVLSLFASQWVSSPVLRLHAWVESLRKGQSLSVPNLPKDEVGILGESFESLRKELEGKRYVEKYVHSLTHEFKSPLTGIVGAAELLERPDLSNENKQKLLNNIQLEANRLHDIAERLLELASLEAREYKLKSEFFDLGLLLEEVCESFEIQAKSLDIELKLVVPKEINAKGERFLIWRSVANLLQNALDFSPRGSHIEITCQKQDEKTIVQITDLGPGIPDFALPRIEEKFFSLERPRTGRKSSGLGLSFVSEVMRLHTGKLSVQSRPGETRVSVIW